jgi:hypothetical protein
VTSQRQTGDFTDASACAVKMLSQDISCEPRDRFPATTQWLARAARAVAGGVRVGFRRFLAALHEGRRRQAAIEQARYRHLIYDPESGLFFGQYSDKRKPPAD